MLSKLNFVVAQCVTEWTQRFALLLTFRANKKESVGIESIILYIVEEIRQFWDILGF
jgi:hypothetical protein